MSTGQILDFTVADLLAGGDDVVVLSTATDEPDGLWNEIVHWPRSRLTAALVAAVGIIQGDREPANGHSDQVSEAGGHGAERVTGRPPVDGR